MTMRSILDWRETQVDKALLFEPQVLSKAQWPPDYNAIWNWRIQMLKRLKDNPSAQEAARAYYSTRPKEFIMHWMDTYDPRRAENKWIPFIMFERQAQMIDFFDGCVQEQEGGLVEKCRDAGATWLACGYSDWRWIFIHGDAIGWGSRKEDLLDQSGNLDSIFEKMRKILDRLPAFWLPEGFNLKKYSTHMKIVNPVTGATITGEAGDNIGRGGRKAQPIDAPVLTPTGWRKMGDIQTGDKVFGANGKPTIVLGTQEHGLRQVYRVVFNDGSWTECDAEHLWQVQDKFTRKNLARSKKIRGEFHQILTTEEIRNKIYHGLRGELNYTIPISEPVKFRSKKNLIDPYLVGVLLGDGSLRNLERTCPSFTSIDPEIVEQVRLNLPKGVSLSSTGMVHRLIDSRKRAGRGYKSPMKELLKYYDLAGHGALDKFIPDHFKFGSISTRLSVLQGLMDTDGYVGKRKGAGKVCISLSSKQLSDDVRWLVQSLGGTARQTLKKTACNDSYTLTINLPVKFNPFRLTRKKERVGERSKYKISRAIESIEISRSVVVKCITVAAADNLYLTQDAIVTHNSLYFKDEAAHYERPEKIEAALGDNTNVQIDISSVNGLGNVFHRRAENAVLWTPDVSMPKGYVRKFIMDWRDHPLKTQEWYDTRRAKYEREGMLHIFAQEVDRDYSGAIQNTIIPYDHIRAAIDAHLKVPYIKEAYDKMNDHWIAGLDVADEGGDRNALTLRQWIVWRHCEEWGERDPGVTARRAILGCRPFSKRIKIMYDCIGVGAGVKSEYNRLTQDEKLINASELPFVPWNAGASVLNPYERVILDDRDSLMNKDYYGNLKAQAWGNVARRFYKTYKAVTQGVVYPVDELISLDSAMPLLDQLCKELAQPTRTQSSRLLMLVEKKPDGTKSPNLADSGIMAYNPVPDNHSNVIVGQYGY